MSEESLPLGRFTVLDLTRARAGPTAARVLADWGANVIYIEHPDRAGTDSSGFTGSRSGPDFQNLHRNKRSLSLDLKHPDGRALFMRLAEKADVIIENFRPDVKHRLGIDFDEVAKINPRIIYGSISGFGQTGPYEKRPGLDQIAQGMGGLMSITGEPGRGPMRVGIPIADLTAGLFASIGILVALIEREKSGEGQWLHTSLLQAQIFMLDFQAARWLMKQEVPPQVGNEHPTSVPTGLFTTKDGAINLAVAGESIWRRFCTAAGHDEWPEDPEFNSNTARFKNRVRLNKLIQDVVATRTSQEWVDLLETAGVPCGPVYPIDRMFDDAQVEHVGIAQEMDTVPFNRTRALGQPMQLTRTPSRLAVRPPEKGEHTEEILREFGFGADDIECLRQKAVI